MYHLSAPHAITSSPCHYLIPMPLPHPHAITSSPCHYHIPMPFHAITSSPPLDYAVHIFHEVKKHGRYSCFLHEDTRLPMIYIPDVTKATISFLEAPEAKMRKGMRTYNIQAVSFTPAELVSELRKYYPNMEVDYRPDTLRQGIGERALTGSTCVHTCACI